MRHFIKSLGRLGSRTDHRGRKARPALASRSRLGQRACRVEGLEQRALLAITGGLLADPLAVETAAAVDTDYGDAPAPYPTLAADNGASHTIGGPYLGTVAPDAETDGQPNATATGDDNAGTDDEDGVTFLSAMKPGETSTLQYRIGGAQAVVKGWVDFNQDGDWDDPGELVVDNFFPQDPGVYTSDPFTVPETAAIGTTFARFRISAIETFGLEPTGHVDDGEVEDYMVTVEPVAGLDYGDAPEPYATTLAANGASHVVDVPGAPWLGGAEDAPDWELDGQPEAHALGDDNDTDGDDENGVTFTSAVLVGQQAEFSYTVSGGQGWVKGWVDFNQDGVWDAEEVVLDALKDPGTYSATFDVPIGAAVGETFARFRVSTDFIFESTGSMVDGEVEDYSVTVGVDENLDWGDAPEPYPTLLVDNGARHTIGGPFFGPAGDNPDADPDGQPDVNAAGDDNDVDGNDEDGVVIPALVPGNTAVIQYTVGGGGGTVKGWIDLNGDGDWDDDGELVVDPGFKTDGTYTEDFFVPLDLAPGTTYARFRIYEGAEMIEVVGPLDNGEVEDHVVTIEEVTTIDWGDAPDPYPTLEADNGARHAIVPVGPYLGNEFDAPDAEPDGQPSADADGDNLNGSNDENGVVFTSDLIAGQDMRMEVTVSRAGGVLQGWIDFNADGDWDDAGESFTFVVLAPGTFPVTVSVPADAVAGPTFARFRVSSEEVGAPTGPAVDGEVEDYRVEIIALSWDAGDAPAPYPTLSVNNGARHLLGGPFMGPSVDPDVDGQPDPQALGDDNDGNDDEDGVTFITPINAGSSSAALTVDMTASPVNGLVSAWIDFNADGDWNDQGERIIHNSPVAKGKTNQIAFSVPANLAHQATFARVRVSSAGGLGFSGIAQDGEVEDYLLDVSPPTGTPDLRPESDTGAFGDDNVTRLNNSVGKGLVFRIPGTVPGATVILYADGTPIGSAVATGTATNIATDQTNVLDDGVHAVYARQTINGTIQSPNSSTLQVFVDTVAPEIDTPDLTDASDTGISSTDDITRGINPVFTGTAADPSTNGYASGVSFATIYADDGHSATQTVGPFYTITMPTLDEGVRTLYVEASDLAGNVATSDTMEVEVDREAPTVTQVLVRGSGWSTGFLQALDTAGLGHPVVPELGYAIPGGAGQLAPIPWSNVDTVTVLFEDTAMVAEDSIVLAGVNQASYAFMPGGFTYDDVGQMATWTLDQALDNDKLLLWLDGVAGKIMDVAGNPLDGEWVNGVSPYPSGDGVAGGNFEFRFNALPGDVNRDLGVKNSDLLAILPKRGATPGSADYSPLLDINADDGIKNSDLLFILPRRGQTLPSGEPSIAPAPAPEMLQQISDDLWQAAAGEEESSASGPRAWDTALLSLMDEAE